MRIYYLPVEFVRSVELVIDRVVVAAPRLVVDTVHRFDWILDLNRVGSVLRVKSL